MLYILRTVSLKGKVHPKMENSVDAGGNSGEVS